MYIQGSRAQAKESIAQLWHERRRQQSQKAAVHSTSVTTTTTTTTTTGTRSDHPHSHSPVIPTLPPLCVILQKAWTRIQQQHQQTKGTVDETHTARRRSSQQSTTIGVPDNQQHHHNNKPQVFPSVLRILQAHVVAQQVEFLQQQQQLEEEENNNNDSETDDTTTSPPLSTQSSSNQIAIPDNVLSVLPAGYQNWDQAVWQQMAASRHRAFWLYDLAAPIRRLVQWRHAYAAKSSHSASLASSSSSSSLPSSSTRVCFLHRLAASADAVWLQVWQRLAATTETQPQASVGLVVQSNWELEQCEKANIVFDGDYSNQSNSNDAVPLMLYDDTTRPAAASHPDSFLRRAVLDGPLRVLTVPGPDEVVRITKSLQRLVHRRQRYNSSITAPSVAFLLRLPSHDMDSWKALAKATRTQVQALGTKLAGISVDLSVHSSNTLYRIQKALQDLLTSTLANTPHLRVDFTGLTSQDLDNSDGSWWYHDFVAGMPHVTEITIDATDALLTTSSALCTRIIGVRTLPDPHQPQQERRHYYIDDGCYGSLASTSQQQQQQQQHQQQQEEEEGDLETFATSSQHLPLPLCGSPKSGDDPDSSASSSLLIASTVWGPTCDGLDRVCQHVNLPALQRDDWLVFPHISPSTTQGTAFNGFSPPDAVYCVLGYFH